MKEKWVTSAQQAAMRGAARRYAERSNKTEHYETRVALYDMEELLEEVINDRSLRLLLFACGQPLPVHVFLNEMLGTCSYTLGIRDTGLARYEESGDLGTTVSVEAAAAMLVRANRSATEIQSRIRDEISCIMRG
jgi:hypothetical protein